MRQLRAWDGNRVELFAGRVDRVQHELVGANFDLNEVDHFGGECRERRATDHSPTWRAIDLDHLLLHHFDPAKKLDCLDEGGLPADR